MLLVTTDVALHSGVSCGRRQVTVRFVCAASVFFYCLEGKHSLVRTFLKVGVVFRTVADLSNNDRDAVPEGMTWRGRTCHCAVQDVNTISYVVSRQNLSFLFVYDGADNDRIVARTGKSDDVRNFDHPRPITMFELVVNGR